MGLVSDGAISCLADLAAQDSGVLDMAAAEGIDLTAKLALAEGELRIELEALLGENSGMEYEGAGALNRFESRAVVVTPPLKQWHTFRALELAYRDAYNSQLNDRYAGRRDQFHELGERAREALMQTG